MSVSAGMHSCVGHVGWDGRKDTLSTVSRGSSRSRDRSRIVVAVRSSSSTYTAMLSILLADRVDDWCRNGHGCASRGGWGDGNWVRSRSTSSRGPSLGRVVGFGNRVRSRSTTTDRWVLGRYVRVGDRIRAGSTTSTERRSSYGRRVGFWDRARAGTTAWERSSFGRVGGERTTAGKGSTLGRIDWEWARSTAMSGRRSVWA